jgi:hypothetical protein
MEKLEQAKQSTADLHWLATLLAGCRGIVADSTIGTFTPLNGSAGFLSAWVHGWSRKLVIVRALDAVRDDLARSARWTASRRAETGQLPPRCWVLDRATTANDLERALLPIDLFPRAAVLLVIFERVPVKDVALLLDSEPDLVRTALAAGLRDLTINLARMRGWISDANNPNIPANRRQHV